MSTPVKLAHSLNSIPADILEDIFVTCVLWYRTRISPLALTAVCHRWRDVTLASGRLWADIDALKPKRAKLFLQRSQNADLDVVWCESTIGRVGALDHTMPDDMPWLYSQVNRFRTLVVHSISTSLNKIFPVVSQSDRVLPRLTALVLAGANEEGCVWPPFVPPFAFGLQLPSLRHITLWGICISADSPLSFLKNSSLLESVVLGAVRLDIDFPHLNAAVRHSPPVVLSRVREFTLVAPNLPTQGLLFERLRFPAECALTVSDYHGRDWGTPEDPSNEVLAMPLHPLLLSTFRPVFTHCLYDGELMELTQQASSKDAPVGRCRLKLVLGVVLRSGRQVNSNTAHALLSNVHTITMATCAGGPWRPKQWAFFARFCPNLLSLSLHGYDRSRATTIPLMSFLALEELRYLDVSNDNANKRTGCDTQPVEHIILNQVLANAASLSAKPLFRVVLYENGKPLDERVIQALRAEVRVDVCRRQDYLYEAGTTQSSREWDIERWWPARSPPPLRQWLSPTAAGCSACNGFLEKQAIWNDFEYYEYHSDDDDED